MPRIALITGATSGIGKATAELFAQKGISLILCGRRQERLAALQKELSVPTTTLCFDVRKLDEVTTALMSLSDDWKNIDILVNNAGNAHGLSPIQESDTNDWDAMLDSNVKGLLYVSRIVTPWMVVRQTGHIINLSSIAGKQTYANGAVYCASKKAVEAISEGMRLDLTQYGIKVTNIAPGAVETEFSEVRFKGDTERAKQVYAGFDALKANDIADIISYVVHAPEHVCISDLTVYPKAQASPSVLYRK